MSSANPSAAAITVPVTKSLDTKFKEKYESFWLYSESHPWRLAQHITLRGIFVGSTLAFLGGIPYTIIKRRGQVFNSLGKITLRGTGIGGTLLALIAANRWYSFNDDQIADRSYRISYNWNQTKWDFYGVEGGILGGYLLRRPFGGVLRGAAVGIALGTFAYIGDSAVNRPSKKTSVSVSTQTT